LGRKRQLVASLEKSEATDRITINSLRRVAEAMECELVYYLRPKCGSFEQLALHLAREVVRPDILAVEHSMALEDQAVGSVDEKIDEEAARLLKRR